MGLQRMLGRNIMNIQEMLDIIFTDFRFIAVILHLEQ